MTDMNARGAAPENIRGEKAIGIDLTERAKFLTDLQVAARLAVSRATIWRWTREGNFPAPVRMVGATRWRLADIAGWEASLPLTSAN